MLYRLLTAALVLVPIRMMNQNKSAEAHDANKEDSITGAPSGDEIGSPFESVALVGGNNIEITMVVIKIIATYMKVYFTSSGEPGDPYQFKFSRVMICAKSKGEQQHAMINDA